MRKLRLTIYVNEADRMGEVPLHEDIVRRLLYFDIAGATVTLGLMGYGKHGRVHRKRLFGVSDDRPVVITAVDDEARLRPILTELKSVVIEGLMTLEEVEVV
jgi:PII-like signaling protein